MRSRYKITESDGIYFITSTIVEWMPVFTCKPYFELMIQSFAFCRENKVKRGYVAAPEHWLYSSARNYLLGDSSVIELDPLPV
jgi:hypothetical protein